ncbi:MAG: T9SS type A sorting domain-containing protein [Paludibacter sp.]|nr:T9SS type A sorting domain-containing protein [Paludibacter sp.]
MVILADDLGYFDAPEFTGTLRLINQQGMQVKQFAANTTVDISYLPQGVYLLAANGIKAQKVFIN